MSHLTIVCVWLRVDYVPQKFPPVQLEQRRAESCTCRGEGREGGSEGGRE